MVFFLLQTRAVLAGLWTARINAQPLRQRSSQSVAGEKVRTGPLRMLWGQKIENSQSDGIAANHSRKLSVQLGFEEHATALWKRCARRLDEVRGDERDAPALLFSNQKKRTRAKLAFYVSGGFPASHSDKRCSR